MINNDSMEKHSYELPACKDNTNMKQLGTSYFTICPVSVEFQLIVILFVLQVKLCRPHLIV